MASKKSPSQYAPKVEAQPPKAIKPWGLGLLTDKVCELLKEPQAVPSVIIANALAQASSEKLDIENLGRASGRPVAESLVPVVRQIMDALRLPGAQPEQIVQKALMANWTMKVREEPKLSSAKKIVHKMAKKMVKKSTNKAGVAKKQPVVANPAPTVIIKKSPKKFGLG